MKQFLFLFISVVLLTSCKTQNIFVQSKSDLQKENVKVDSTFLPNDNYEYHIRKDDKLNISIWNNDEISVGSIYGIYNSSEGYGKWLMVDKKGEIAIPASGNFKVEGLTLVEFKELLYKQLSKTIQNPVIDVKVLNKDVTVLGEVKNPGKHLLEKENYSLLEVLGMAGDFDTYANKTKVQVVRKENNSIKAVTLDLTKMKNYEMNNVAIHPGDVVLVPAKKGKEWDKRSGSTIVPAGSAITTLILILKLFI